MIPVKRFLFLTILFINLNVIYATPSTIIWIPSVDLQPFKVIHFGIDNYFTLFNKKGLHEGGFAAPTDLGLTIGILPFNNLEAEVGVDLFAPQHSPWLFNGKIGISEGAFAEWSPAIAIGGYNFGTEKNVTDYNILFAVAAKTVPLIGRVSAGYFQGNKNILTDPEGRSDNKGYLLSIDKQVTEIDDRLWAAVDYQSGKSALGALSFGFAWSFSKNVSVILAEVFYNNNAPGTFTTQVDINL